MVESSSASHSFLLLDRSLSAARWLRVVCALPCKLTMIEEAGRTVAVYGDRWTGETIGRAPDDWQKKAGGAGSRSMIAHPLLPLSPCASMLIGMWMSKPFRSGGECACVAIPSTIMNVHFRSYL